MPAVSGPAEILVTGASGFLGVHTCRAFLARGYKVRGTVRSPSKGEWLKKLFDAEYPSKFSWVIVKDIGEPGAFDDAVKGVDAIAHTASPLELVAADVEPDVLIKPAVNGTTSVLKSAKEFGRSVKRVVTVSSVSALDYPRDPPYAYTTDDWNMASVEEARTKGAAANQYLKYCASKTLAERAFWDFISDNKDSITFDGATVLPPWIYGEVIHEVDKFERLNVSVKKLYDQLADPYPENEDTLGDWAGDHIHVDDVARTLVDAIAREDLAGRRLLISQGALTRQDFLDAANSIKSQLPPLPFEIPKGKPGYGDTRRNQFFTFASEPTKKLLGHEFKQLPDMIKDVLQSLHNRGLLPKA